MLNKSLFPTSGNHILLLQGVVFLLFCSTCLLCAQTPLPTVLATIELKPEELLHSDDMRTMELYGANKTKGGKFYSIEVFTLLKSFLKPIADKERREIVVVFESADGSTTAASLAELDPAQTKLPILLLLKECQDTLPDSVSVSDVKGKEGVVDLSVVERAVGQHTRIKYFVNDLSFTRADQKQLTSAQMEIMFPRDRSMTRWLANIRRIYLMKV